MDPIFNKMVSGSGGKDFAPSNLRADQNRAIITELSSRRPPQLVFRTNEVLGLDLQKPPGVFRTGYLKISSTSVETVKVVIGKKPEYEYVKSLLQSFNPQVMREV